MLTSFSDRAPAPHIPNLLKFAAAMPFAAAVTWLIYLPSMPDFPAPQTVFVLPGAVSYRQPGEFLKDGAPVDGPLEPVRLLTPLLVMRHQVSEQQYAQCVDDGACAALDHPAIGDDIYPATGVSYLEAEKYSQWLSRKTGEYWRLPSDQEWAALAGSRYADDAIDGNEAAPGPAGRWLKRYEAESAAGNADSAVHPSGFFGANENGLEDIAGNVWEWTSTCYTRTALSSDNSVISSIDNCGVRVAEGRHRAYMTSFIGNAKGGGCSAGSPPDHLGMRLIREKPGFWRRLWFRAAHS